MELGRKRTKGSRAICCAKKQRGKEEQGGSRCKKRESKIERETMKKEPREFILTRRHILLSLRETAEARIRLSSPRSLTNREPEFGGRMTNNFIFPCPLNLSTATITTCDDGIRHFFTLESSRVYSTRSDRFDDSRSRMRSLPFVPLLRSTNTYWCQRGWSPLSDPQLLVLSAHFLPTVITCPKFSMSTCAQSPNLNTVPTLRRNVDITWIPPIQSSHLLLDADVR